MSKLSKIVVTIVIVFVFILLFGGISALRAQGGATGPGLIGLIVFAGFIGAMRAIWKKPKNDDDNNKSSFLQK